MFQEQRPTCVTVIGWAWIVIGGMMCLSATMALCASFSIRGIDVHSPDSLFISQIFPVIALVQLGVGGLGAVSGYYFLQLKARARTELEALTWLLLLFVVGFMVFWEYQWISLPSAPSGSEVLGAIMGMVISTIYIVPLVVMLKTLRGPKVNDAIERLAARPRGDEHLSASSTQPNSQESDPGR